MNTKICGVCKLEKSKDEFSRNKNKKDGLQYRCKICTSKYMKEYYSTHQKESYVRTKKYYQEHKEQHLLYGKQYRKTEAYRLVDTERTLIKKYNLTLDEYQNMLQNQCGGCAICGKPESYKPNPIKGDIRRLAVDHSHQTGKLRGLLCSSCNRALGLFKDSPELMKRAIEYLESY